MQIPPGPVASKLLTPSVGGLAAGDQLGSLPIRQFPARDHGFKTPRLRATAPGSVPEMTGSGEDHGHAPLVGRTDDLLIAHRTTRLNGGGGAGLGRSD